MPAVIADAESVAAGGADALRRGFSELLTRGSGDPQPSRETQELADSFVSPLYRGGRFLMGRNEHAAALLPLTRIDGIIDDFSAETTWRGHPVLRSSDVPMQAIVVNCALSIRPVSASQRLRQLGLLQCLNYSDLLATHPPLIPVPAFVSDTRADVQRHGAEWRWLFDRLADRTSQRVLEDVLRFRLSADPRGMESYSVRFADQYFEDFLRLNAEVFIDAGGFDGDTTEEFCSRHPDYQRVILFEPSARNMQRARRRLAGRRNIEFVAQGLSDAIGLLSFDADAGPASAIVQQGATRIAVTTLDASVSQPVSFIKMDLEGWELRALAGASGHIRRDAPKLAISVYHSACDFWRIPQFILGLRAGYQLYLRHYTQGWSETVMFFVPCGEDRPR